MKKKYKTCFDVGCPPWGLFQGCAAHCDFLEKLEKPITGPTQLQLPLEEPTSSVPDSSQ